MVLATRNRWAAAVLMVAAALGATACSAAAPTWSFGPASGAPDATSPVTGSPGAPSTAAATPGFAFPATANGLPVLTVSQLLAARPDRTPGQHFALKGYWSGAFGSMHSCPAPAASDGTIANPGRLEIYCHDVTEFGIAEAREPILLVKHVGNMTYSETGTASAKITPYVPEGIASQMDPAAMEAQPWVPIPIVVVGHFDDPLAAECRPEARQLCEDRFVVDRLVDFAISVLPSPGTTPSPSPYEPGPAETPLFTAEQCAHAAGKRIDFAYVGWIDGGKLKLTSGMDFSGTTMWVAISKDPVPLGEWFELPGDSRESLPMGELVCYAFGGVPAGQGVAFDSVAGTAYRVYRDGSTQRPSAAP